MTGHRPDLLDKSMNEPVRGQDSNQSGDVELALLLTAAEQKVDRQVDRLTGRRAVRVEKKQRTAETGINTDQVFFRAGHAFILPAPHQP